MTDSKSLEQKLMNCVPEEKLQQLLEDEKRNVAESSNERAKSNLLRILQTQAQELIESGVAVDNAAICPITLRNICAELLERRAAETAAEHPDTRRLRWLANTVLFCDYGDNSTKQIGWRVYEFIAPLMYGASINEAIDAAVSPARQVPRRRAEKMVETKPPPPGSLQEILEWIESMSDDKPIKNMARAALEKLAAKKAFEVPVAWRKLIDSAYERRPRYGYSEEEFAGGEPLYTRAAEKSAAVYGIPEVLAYLNERAAWLKKEWQNGGNYTYLHLKQEECEYIASCIKDTSDRLRTAEKTTHKDCGGTGIVQWDNQHGEPCSGPCPCTPERTSPDRLHEAEMIIAQAVGLGCGVHGDRAEWMLKAIDFLGTRAAQKTDSKLPGVVAGSELEEQIRMAHSHQFQSIPRRVCTAVHESVSLICGKCGWKSESDTALYCSHCGKAL